MQAQNILDFWFNELTPKQHFVKDAALGYGEVFGALEGATASLGRKINPTLYTPADWAKRVQNDNAVVTRVWQQPKIWLIGSEEKLNALSL